MPACQLPGRCRSPSGRPRFSPPPSYPLFGRNQRQIGPIGYTYLLGRGCASQASVVLQAPPIPLFALPPCPPRVFHARASMNRSILLRPCTIPPGIRSETRRICPRSTREVRGAAQVILILMVCRQRLPLPPDTPWEPLSRPRMASQQDRKKARREPPDPVAVAEHTGAVGGGKAASHGRHRQHHPPIRNHRAFPPENSPIIRWRRSAAAAFAAYSLSAVLRQCRVPCLICHSRPREDP